MPKVNKDDLLLEKVAAFVSQEQSYEAAATRLNVKTTTLWRFVKSGTAIGRTRAALELGLTKVNRERKMERTGSAAPERAMGLKGFSGKDLSEMRALCSRVVAWLDMAEAALANTRATGPRGQSGKTKKQSGGQDRR